MKTAQRFNLKNAPTRPMKFQCTCRIKVLPLNLLTKSHSFIIRALAPDRFPLVHIVASRVKTTLPQSADLTLLTKSAAQLLAMNGFIRCPQ